MSDTQNDRQSNRGNGNRRPRRNNNNNRNRNNNNRNRSQRPPKPLKLSFFQKILKAIGLFDEEKARKQQQEASRRSGDSRQPRSNTRDSKPSTPKRTPQQVPVETPRLYVGNLSYDATEYDIEDLFKGVGTVKKVEIIYNRNTHKSKGYGFVQMLNIDEAKRAVEVLHDQPFMGRQLVVNGSKSRKDSDPTKSRDEELRQETADKAE